MKKCVVLCSNCHKKLHWDEDKIENMKKNIIHLIEKRKELIKKRKYIVGLCRECGKNKDEVEFVKGRCFCKKCYREYQKNKMQERRKITSIG